jgi:hypothetical protein
MLPAWNTALACARNRLGRLLSVYIFGGGNQTAKIVGIGLFI